MTLKQSKQRKQYNAPLMWTKIRNISFLLQLIQGDSSAVSDIFHFVNGPRHGSSSFAIDWN
jgi:hypothetical protein